MEPCAAAFAVEPFRVAAVAAHVHAQANVAWQALCDVGEEVDHGAIVANAQIVAFVVVVADATVHHHACAEFHIIILAVAKDAYPALKQTVHIGGVGHVALCPLLGGDTVGADVEVGRNAECERLSDVHIVELPSVVVHAFEGTVAERLCFGGYHHGRVEVRDAGAVDGGAEREFQRVERVELVLQTCRRHPVAEVAAEILLVAVGEFGAQVAKLVAKSGACCPVAAVEGVAKVGGSHLCEVVEAVVAIALRVAGVLENGVTLIAAVDVFQARFQFVVLGERPCPVELGGLFQEVLCHVVVRLGVGESGAHHVGICGDLVVLIVIGGNQIRERERFVGAMRLVLIVEAAVEREYIVAGIEPRAVVAVERFAGCIAHDALCCTVGAVAVIVASER